MLDVLHSFSGVTLSVSQSASHSVSMVGRVGRENVEVSRESVKSVGSEEVSRRVRNAGKKRPVPRTKHRQRHKGPWILSLYLNLSPQLSLISTVEITRNPKPISWVLTIFSLVIPTYGN